MAKTNYFVYAHVNKINRKVYVGISYNPVLRWGKNGRLYKGSLLWKAIKKYGWDNFDHIILESDVTIKQAQALERVYIISLNAKVPNGYNLTDGGEGTQGYRMSEETKKRIGEKLSVIKKGVTFSDEHKKALSVARVQMLKTKIKNGEKLPAKRKPVLQFDKSGKFIKRFESATDAYNEFGICHINSVCNGVRKTAGGFTWRWEEDYGAY